MSDFESDSSSVAGVSDSSQEQVKLGMHPKATKVHRSDWKKQGPGKWGEAEHRPALESDPSNVKTHTLPSTYDNETVDATPFRGDVDTNQKTLENLRRVGTGALPPLPDTSTLNESQRAEVAKKEQARAFGKAVYESGPKLDSDDELGKVTTRYMDTDSQERHEVGFKDGRMLGSDGKNLDTTKSTGFGGFGAKHDVSGRNIFAMEDNGTIKTADAWGEGQLKEASDSADSQLELAYVNHSSLIGGGKAAGAGEMRVEDGQVKVVSDNSGHYTPDSEMMHQTIGHLEDQGVGLEGMTTEFMDKRSGATREEIGSLASEANNFEGGRLQTGALEFMSHAGGAGASAETQMRGARKDRMGMMSDIRGFDQSTLKSTGTRDRSGVNKGLMSDDQEPLERASLGLGAKKSPGGGGEDSDGGYKNDLIFEGGHDSPPKAGGAEDSDAGYKNDLIFEGGHELGPQGRQRRRRRSALPARPHLRGRPRLAVAFARTHAARAEPQPAAKRGHPRQDRQAQERRARDRLIL